MVKGKLVLSRAGKRFLSHGTCAAQQAASVVAECDSYIRQFAQEDLPEAILWARKFSRHARRLPPGQYSIALRTLGWVLLLSAAFKESGKAYLKARDLIRRDASARARIDRILVDIYMHLGDIPEARRRARNAIRTFRRLGDQDGEAKTKVNYANSYHRQDRHAEALRIYEDVIAYYAHSKDHLTLGTCYYNCANSYVQLLRFDEANTYYRKAESVFAQIGYDLYVNEARYGRAWLEKLRGNYHVALRSLEECQSYYVRIAQPKGVALCNLDRADVMLELQLLSDARQLATLAEKQARELDLLYEAAKSALFLAKAAFALGERTVARQAIKRAKRDFKRIQNKNMLAVAEFYEQLHNKQSTGTNRLRRMQQIVDRGQLPLWLAICDLTRMAQDSKCEDTVCADRLQKNHAVQAVPHLYASWQTLLGDRAMQAGNMARARKNWQRAANTLDKMRVNLPPVDIRQSLSEHDLNPHKRMLKSTLAENPQDAAIWSERSKTAGIWSRLDQAPGAGGRKLVDEKLSQLARQVTALSVSLEGTRGPTSEQLWKPGTTSGTITAHIRRNMLALAEESETASVSQSGIRRLIHQFSADQPIVQFHFEDDELLGFVHHYGETKVHRYEHGETGLTRFLGQWNILLGEMLERGKRVRRSDREEEMRILEQLGDWLWKPLEISRSHAEVAVIPAGRMTCLPWSAIRVDGLPLIQCHRLSLSPSLRHYANSAKGTIDTNAAAVLIGDTSGLTNTRGEVSSIASLRGVTARVVAPCRREDWPRSEEALLWHYVGHAEFRGDNPFYSSLSLADGPLFAADFRLRSCRVALVTLAACRTGIQSSLPNYESTGLVRSLLEMGAKNVIASHWPVSDRATADWMSAFYAKINNEYALSEAVQMASCEMSATYPCAGQWAAFSLFGSGKGFQLPSSSKRVR